MKITRFCMERLTPRTRELNDAREGFCCNKTMFLFQDHMQTWNEEDTETWTIIHYERDRFGLLNGLIYLMQMRNKKLDAFFPRTEEHETLSFWFEPNMTFTEISRYIDILYMPISVEYR